MPRQARTTVSEAWRRQLPIDVQQTLVYVENIAMREKGQPEFFNFVVHAMACESRCFVSIALHW
jgi:hypothetical protein